MAKRVRFTYAPSRWKGLLFLTACCTILAALEFLLFRDFDMTQVGILFFLRLIALILLAVPLLFLLYRLFSLIFSGYQLERDGLHIHWGLRSEVIPLNAIEWIRSPQEMNEDVPWSVLPMPGAYLGTVRSGEQTTFEFLASDMGKMLFLGTSRFIYVISPADPSGFLTGFERILQMGALSNPRWTTTRPGNWILEAWRDQAARYSVILSILLLGALYIWTGSRFQGSSGQPVMQVQTTGPTGAPMTISLLRIPMIATVIWIAGLLLGLQVFQRRETRRTGELVWAALPFALLQFLIAAVVLFRG